MALTESVTDPMNRNLLPLLAALFAVIFWGISFVATKAALREISPITLISVRFAMGTALLCVLAARKSGGQSLPPREAWPALFVMGFFGIFLHQMIQSFALTMTSAMHCGWLIGL